VRTPSPCSSSDLPRNLPCQTVSNQATMHMQQWKSKNIWRRWHSFYSLNECFDNNKNKF
jgi:hypothetical protein